MTMIEIIMINLKVIDTLSADTAPMLCRLKSNTSIIEHLRGFMLHMLSYSYPFWPAHDPKFYLFSKQHLKNWCKLKGIPGSTNAWQSHLIFLADCKLIKFFRPTGYSEDPTLNRIWQRALARRVQYRHAETLWSVPLYTPGVLEYAEKVAAEYLNSGINLTHLTKEDVIRIRGQEIANSLYLDGRTQSQKSKYVHDHALESLHSQIMYRQYATVSDTWRDILDDLLADGHEFPEDPFEELDEESRVHYNEWIDYQHAFEKLMVSRKCLAREAHCHYRQSTRLERTELDLPVDYGRWLFLPDPSWAFDWPVFFNNFHRKRRLPRKAGALLYFPKE